MSFIVSRGSGRASSPADAYTTSRAGRKPQWTVARPSGGRRSAAPRRLSAGLRNGRSMQIRLFDLHLHGCWQTLRPTTEALSANVRRPPNADVMTSHCMMLSCQHAQHRANRRRPDVRAQGASARSVRFVDAHPQPHAACRVGQARARWTAHQAIQAEDRFHGASYGRPRQGAGPGGTSWRMKKSLASWLSGNEDRRCQHPAVRRESRRAPSRPDRRVVGGTAERRRVHRPCVDRHRRVPANLHAFPDLPVPARTGGGHRPHRRLAPILDSATPIRSDRVATLGGLKANGIGPALRVRTAR